jgi:Protein of unknown function (DUF2637)
VIKIPAWPPAWFRRPRTKMAAPARRLPAQMERRLARITSAAVLGVGVIAAVISFLHIEHLSATHGQTPLASYLLPLSIDGDVVASSLTMLRAAWKQQAAPWLGRGMLLAGVGATLAANVAYGLGSGVEGALISGWPALAFIGCAEMAIMSARRFTPVPDPGGDEEPGDEDAQRPAAVPSWVPLNAESAALMALRATLAAGNALSSNQIQERFRLSRAEVTKVRARVLAETNGHAPETSEIPRFDTTEGNTQ